MFGILSKLLLPIIANPSLGWVVKARCEVIGKLTFVRSDSPWMYFRFEPSPSWDHLNPTFDNCPEPYTLCHPRFRMLSLSQTRFTIFQIGSNDVAIKFIW